MKHDLHYLLFEAKELITPWKLAKRNQEGLRDAWITLGNFYREHFYDLGAVFTITYVDTNESLNVKTIDDLYFENCVKELEQQGNRIEDIQYLALFPPEMRTDLDSLKKLIHTPDQMGIDMPTPAEKYRDKMVDQSTTLVKAISSDSSKALSSKTQETSRMVIEQPNKDLKPFPPSQSKTQNTNLNNSAIVEENNKDQGEEDDEDIFLEIERIRTNVVKKVPPPPKLAPPKKVANTKGKSVQQTLGSFFQKQTK